jgi:hypothetical protein
MAIKCRAQERDLGVGSWRRATNSACCGNPGLSANSFPLSPPGRPWQRPGRGKPTPRPGDGRSAGAQVRADSRIRCHASRVRSFCAPLFCVRTCDHLTPTIRRAIRATATKDADAHREESVEGSRSPRRKALLVADPPMQSARAADQTGSHQRDGGHPDLDPEAGAAPGDFGQDDSRGHEPRARSGPGAYTRWPGKSRPRRRRARPAPVRAVGDRVFTRATAAVAGGATVEGPDRGRPRPARSGRRASASG